MKYWRRIALNCLPLAACATGDVRHNPPTDVAVDQTPEQLQARTLVYDCNGFDFVGRLGPDEITVWLEDGAVDLPHVPSASGALYEAGDISFWSKGDDAMLTTAGQTHVNCQLQPQRAPWEDARRRGVDFRAVGNEPGWHLEVHTGGQLLLVTAYGMQRVVVPDPVEESAGTVRVYRGTTATHEVRVEIADVSCFDTMSGASFPTQVVVTLDGTTYHGCGQHLDYPWEEQQ